MINIIIGVILVFGGGAYIFLRLFFLKKKLINLQYNKTASIKDSLEIFRELLAVNINAKTYVEIRGNIMSNSLIKATFCNRDCVYYENTVNGIVEKEVEVKQADGSLRKEIKNETFRISSDKKTTEFYITDTDLQDEIYIDFQSFGQKCETETAAQSVPKGMEGNFPTLNPNFTPGFKQYSIVERFVPNNGKLLAVGSLSKQNGKYTLSKSNEKGHPSYLTLKSKEDYVKKMNKKTSFFVVGGLLIILGIIFLVSGFGVI